MILLFNVGSDNYGINVKNIIEVLPSVTLKHFPQGPEYVAGLLNYRGLAVPVIDLTLLMSERASRDRISSRIILVDYFSGSGDSHALGLRVEKVTETVKIPDAMFTRSGVETGNAPFLGDVAIHAGNMVQVIEIKKVLPDSIKAMLFNNGKESDVVPDAMEC